MNKWNRKKGMTLVELIIAVAFTAIVIAAACSVLYLAGNFFKSGTANASNQQNASLVESYLQRYAATASQVSTTDSKTGVAFTLSPDGELNINDHTGTSSSVKTSIRGIENVSLQVEDKLLTYIILSKDGTYTLKGGIVLNNCKSGAVVPAKLKGNCLFLGFTTS